MSDAFAIPFPNNFGFGVDVFWQVFFITQFLTWLLLHSLLVHNIFAGSGDLQSYFADVAPVWQIERDSLTENLWRIINFSVWQGFQLTVLLFFFWILWIMGQMFPWCNCINVFKHDVNICNIFWSFVIHRLPRMLNDFFFFICIPYPVELAWLISIIAALDSRGRLHPSAILMGDLALNLWCYWRAYIL